MAEPRPAAGPNLAGKKPAKTSSPLVRQLFDIVDASGRDYYDIHAQTGVHPVTLSYWKHGRNAPRWVDFENVAKALGYRIVLEKETLP